MSNDMQRHLARRNPSSRSHAAAIAVATTFFARSPVKKKILQQDKKYRSFLLVQIAMHCWMQQLMQ
jgi:hypothetical protein